MNIKNGILNVPKHGNKHDLIHFVTPSNYFNATISLQELLSVYDYPKISSKLVNTKTYQWPSVAMAMFL